MISSVYSYYLSQYGNNLNSKYDYHSKKQLKSSFGKVAKINSQAPTYKTDFSEEAQKYAIDLKENARRLNYIANDLSDSRNGEMTFKKSARSAKPDQVTAEYIGNDPAQDDISFDISVDQLATNQVNTGNYLQPTAKILAPGTYSFDLNINNLTYEFEFDINKEETTNDVQNKISRLINRSNIGINAQINTDSLGNTALEISSDTTGIYGAKPTIFNITSEAPTGNDNSSAQPQSDTITNESAAHNQELISTLGLARVSSYPKNAEFSINGEHRFSQNNNITINRTFLLNLKQTTGTDPVTISLSNDSDSVVESIDELISGYNDLITIATDQNNNKFQGNEKLKKEFGNIVHSFTSQLKKTGLDVTDNGVININKDSIRSVAEEGRIGDVFDSLDSFKKAIQQKAEYITLDPMRYVNNKMIAYKNPHRITSDPYNLSAYSGMMFNGYI